MWIWVGAVVAVLFFIMDWLIVMGSNPKKWRGGDKK